MRSHVTALAQMVPENVKIVAICDCDQSKLDAATKIYPELEGLELTRFDDMRKLFDDKSVNAITNGLGDRWHALSTVWACQAGKDMYVEKPGTHNLFEGRQMVAAARKYNRMVQHGTQNPLQPQYPRGASRNCTKAISAISIWAEASTTKFVATLARSIRPIRRQASTGTSGSAPSRCALTASSGTDAGTGTWKLSSGCFANQAIHELDVLRWGLKLDKHPVFVNATGGKYVHEDDRTCPTHVAISYQFEGNKPMVTYEHRSWYTNSEAGFRDPYPFVQPNFPVGTIFFGDKGYQIFPDYSSYYSFFGLKGEPGPSKFDEEHHMADLPHFQNWVKGDPQPGP